MFAPFVQAQLAKDAPYAWFLFDQAKQHARYYFVDFQEQAERLEAYLDALGIALMDGEPVEDWLASDDWGSAFVLAVLGIRYHQPRLFDRALDQLKADEATHYQEIVDACLWEKSEKIEYWLLRCYEHPSPVAQQTAIAVARAHASWLHPSVMQQVADNPVPAVRIQWLHWLGEHQAQDHLDFVRQHYADEQPDIAFAAARAGLLLGGSAGDKALQRFAVENNPHLLDAITLVFLQADNPAHVAEWIENLWASPDLSMRVKLYAVAVAGLPEQVERLFPAMADPETARAAGEAFTLLTGADLDEQDLEGGETCTDCEDDIAEQPTLTERRREDPFISDWEDDLPDPCPEAVAQWWRTHQAHFKPGVAYLAGLEIQEENLRRILANGNQRQRALAALHGLVKYHQPWLDCGWPIGIQLSK
jgi:uncharacterized protein (TIGR02270 family)